jgi:hypothetical protein
MRRRRGLDRVMCILVRENAQCGTRLLYLFHCQKKSLALAFRLHVA